MLAQPRQPDCPRGARKVFLNLAAMGLEQCGRGGLPPEITDAALRLLAREKTTGERLTNRVIAQRVGCSAEIVRRLRHGIHRSQRDEDRRGTRPERVRLAEELLGEGWPLDRVSRFLGMDRKAVRKISRGEYITQRGKRYATIANHATRI